MVFSKFQRWLGANPTAPAEPPAQEPPAPVSEPPAPPPAGENPAPAKVSPEPTPPPAPASAPIQQFVTGADYLTPPDLARDPDPPVHALLIGSCFLQSFFAPRYKQPAGWQHDFLLVNGPQDMPEELPAPAAAYDFQLIQIPLRMILPVLRLSQLAHDDLEGFQDCFDEAAEAVRMHLRARMRYNLEHGLTSFVCNFMQPQFPSTGLLLPRYDLRNIEFFVDELNRTLAGLLPNYPNTYLFDLDRLSASLGRRHVQDDSFVPYGHNAQAIGHFKIGNRLEELAPLGFQIDLRPANAFRDAALAHVRALHRALLQPDAVKLVVLDLDDTLWRGIAAETPDPNQQMIEGWPYGLIEALLVLKRRGILLGIISRNDEARIRALWPLIMGEHLDLGAFADLRINFRPKPENMQAMLAAMNLLPRNVVFIDDNPAERAQMQAAFPEIRTLGGNPFHTRRILLMAAQTQTAIVSAESAARTGMIQAQITRERARAEMDLAEFQRLQNVQIRMRALAGREDPQFPRAFELLNKSNQFNTTGQRWIPRAINRFFEEGGRIWVLNVTDRYTEYGLTGVILCKQGEITQFVMSCRVLGMGVEQAALRALSEANPEGLTARLTPTDINKPCHNLFRNAGFAEQEGQWHLPAGTLPPAPPFATLSLI